MASLHSSGWRVTVAERAWSYWSWMWLLESLTRSRTAALCNFHKLSFASKLLLQSKEVANFCSMSKSLSDELLQEVVVVFCPVTCPVSSWCGLWWLLQVPLLCLDLSADFPTGIRAAPLSSSHAPEVDLWFCADLSSWWLQEAGKDRVQSVVDAPGSVTEAEQTQCVLSTSGRSGSSSNRGCILGCQIFMPSRGPICYDLYNLYLIAFVFLASVPPCLDYELFNFIRYCMEEKLFSSVSRHWPFLLSEMVNMEELLIFFIPLGTYRPM